VARSIARDTVVDRDGLEAFVRPRHHGILGTWRSDGSPQLSPVTMGLGPDGAVLVASYPERAKVRNLRRRPEATMCVLSDDFRSISGEHPDWAEYRQAMVDQGNVLIRLVPERWGPVSRGGFPAHLA
jgi:hypothetical protein